MAALSAGEVFVNLVVRGGAVKPALAAAQEQVKAFGGQITALSVATGNLIAQGVTKALGMISNVASAAWDRAKVNPRTAGAILDLQRNIDKAYDSFLRSAGVIIEAFLPALNEGAKFLVYLADQVQFLISWLDEFGITAALQAGDFAAAFDIAWAEIQILFLQGSQLVLKAWRTFSDSMLLVWDYVIGQVLKTFSDALKQIGGNLAGAQIALEVYFPSLAKQTSMLKDLGFQMMNLGQGVDIASSGMDQAMLDRMRQREEQANAEQQILQDQIDSLRQQADTQSEQARKKRDIERTETAAGLASAMAGRASQAQGGLMGTFAIGASGGNVMFQTQKDMLREMREQKELQRKQLEELKKDKQARFK